MINRFLLIFALVTFFCCQKEDFQNNLAETILGNWNIEEGGNFFFEKDSFSASLGCNTFFGEIKITDDSDGRGGRRCETLFVSLRQASISNR